MDSTTLVVIGLVICGFGAVSRRAERTPVTPPMIFVGVGVLLGGAGLGWLDLPTDHGAVHLLAELTLALVLFTDASRIDVSCLRREQSIPARLLGFGLPLTIALGGAVALWTFPGIEPAQALLIAAILAPTDAALGQAVVSSPLVPLRIRQSLNVESGLNDGIALPVVLVLASLSGRTQRGDLAHWLRFAGLALLLGPLVGVGVGWLAGRVVERATRTGWMNAPFQRISALGLALLAFAGAELIGGNGFIAAFVAGLTLGNTARSVCGCLYDFAEAEGQFLTLLVFLVFGASMVPAAFPHWTIPMVAYAVLSLSVIRMLPVAISLLGTGLRLPSVAFLGWFGPRGLASVLFALLVVEDGGLEEGPFIEAAVVLTVLASTFLHGFTSYSLASRYGAFATRGEAEAEHREAMELPVRVRHATHARIE